MTPEQVWQIINPTPDYAAVAQRLRKSGWRKGWYGEEAGPNCVIGATILTMETCYFNLEDLKVVVQEQYPEFEGSIPKFNDHPDTTFDDVLLVLDKAARRVEERA